jgi:hypothetical protein
MKHLKKFNENINKNVQKEEILDILSYMLDEPNFYLNERDEEENKINLSFTYEQYKPIEPINLTSDYEDFIKYKTEVVEFYQSFLSSLKRFTEYGYEWAFETDDDVFYLTVFYKDNIQNLIDAFNYSNINAPILKNVLKRDYNLNLLSHNYIAATSGYYGKNAYFIISVNGNIDDYTWNRLSHDLISLKKKKFRLFSDVSKEYYNESGSDLTSIKLST